MEQGFPKPQITALITVDILGHTPTKEYSM